MIQKLRYATVADIGVYDMTFYDKRKKEELVKFCEQHKISFLPAKNRIDIYKLKNNDFYKVQGEERERMIRTFSIQPEARIFVKDTLERFHLRSHDEIRLIMDNDRIQGVVHIIDYNNEFIKVEFYRALYNFERNLRKILIREGLTNEDFLAWVEEQGETGNEQDKHFWNSRLSKLSTKNEVDKRETINPFQAFYLNELLQYAIDIGVLPDLKYIDKKAITDLRNSIMHANDVTSVTVEGGETTIYHFDNLKEFVENANRFFSAYVYLEDKLRFSEGG